VGFADRLRAWLRGDAAGQPRSSARSFGAASSAAPRRRTRTGRRGQHPAGSFDGSALLDFARSRNGVEVYLEPRTNLYGDSVLLVADDGEYLRRPVPDAQTVRSFCSEHGIPVYDAARTGYPRRVRDYDRGVRPTRIGLDDLPPWPGVAARTDDAGDADDVETDRTDRADHDDRGPVGTDGDDDPPPPPPAAR